jgi:hypothetical protein
MRFAGGNQKRSTNCSTRTADAVPSYWPATFSLLRTPKENFDWVRGPMADPQFGIEMADGEDLAGMIR